MTAARIDTPTTAAPPRSRAYSVVIGLAAVVVLLQAVWAGVFIREHKDYPHVWIVVHARGADVAIGLGVVALIILIARVRARRDLIIGTSVFVVALIVEAYIGGLVGPNPGLSLIHFPLAMAIMGLSVWLPFRSASRGRT